MTLSLLGYDSIPTDGSGRILISDINGIRGDALICRSDESVGRSRWYYNAVEQSTAETDILEINDRDLGWSVTRDFGIIRLRIFTNTPNRVEGVFTCEIEGDSESPISVGIYYASECCHTIIYNAVNRAGLKL